MFIDIDIDGNATWKFYRKAYQKARRRKVGQRYLNEFLKTPGSHGFIKINL